MPLNEQEQLLKNQIEHDMEDLRKAISEDVSGNVASLSKLDTRGKAPDFSTFSDQDLRNIFDKTSRTFYNQISGNDSNPAVKRFSVSNVADAKLTSAQLNRAELELYTSALLKSHGNFIDPNELGHFQEGLASVLDRGPVERINLLNMQVKELKKSVEEREGIGALEEEGSLKESIEQLSSELQEKLPGLIKVAEEYGFQAPRQGMESMFLRNYTADQVAEEVNKILPDPKWGETRDLRGVNLKGLDVSQCDFTTAVLDIPTLASATGIEQAKGVPQEIKEGVIKLRKLEAERTKLETKASALEKPWSMARFKAFFNGGATKLQKELNEKLSGINREILPLVSPAKERNVLKNEQEQSLKETLNHPSLSKAFLSFASDKGKGAEVDFLKEVADLQRQVRLGGDLSELRIQAYGIQQRYFSNQSDQPIKLEHEAKDQVNLLVESDALEEMDHQSIGKLFVAAEREVKNDLAQGVHQDFTKSQAFKNGQNPRSVGDGFQRNKPSLMSGEKKSQHL